MHMFYHVTTKGALDSIMSQGLQPAIGARSAALGEEVYRVYLFTSLEASQVALCNWLGEAFESVADELVVLEVDGRDLQFVSEAGYEVVTACVIEPQRIIRVLDESGAPIKHQGAATAALAMK